MSLNVFKILIVSLSLMALAIPSSATSAQADAFISIEVNPAGLYIGETATVNILLNNVPVEGYKSAEFTCTYNPALVEKSNIAFTELFGLDPATAIHEPQMGTFIVAVAGANTNRALTGGPAFSFSAKGLQAGQSQLLCTTRVSRGDNQPIDLPGATADLTVLGVDASPTPLVLPTAVPQEQPSATSVPLELPTPSPNGSLSGQVIASKPVTVTLLDANNAVISSMVANPDGTFSLTALGGNYTLLATAAGSLSRRGNVSLPAGNATVKPVVHLLAGDVDGNNVIDQFDALTIGISYTSSTPEAANLNNDGIIDFLDLELLAENYRQSGPSVWE